MPVVPSPIHAESVPLKAQEPCYSLSFLHTLENPLSLRLSRPHLCFNLWRRPCRVGQREGVFLFGFGGCLRAIPFNCITVILPSL